MEPNPLRNLPSVDRAVRVLGDVGIPRPALVALTRRELAAMREAGDAVTADDAMARLRAAVDDLRRARIQPVINGTGIIIHTNLGRAPLGSAVIATLATIGANYNNLEYDLTGGERGGRAAYLEHNLAVLCDAPAATVVNNCAAALVLILRHLAGKPPRNEVVISRGELVQIGGGFRVPEILEASGAVLREVGTTNKTTIDDYRRAFGERTAMVLKVHRSNFYMGGFTESPPADEIAASAREAGVPFVEDLGSGATSDTGAIGEHATHEPTPAEVLARGVDLVCFSGDKLLGGPQAGIIAGSAALVGAIKKEPFFRALRCDKLILAALQTTVDLHLSRPAGTPDDAEIPVLAMMRTPNEQLRARAEKLIDAVRGLPLKATVGDGEARVGGGSLPRTVIPSVTLDLLPTSMGPQPFASRLRGGGPPIIGYVSEDVFRLDLRTVFPRQDALLAKAIRTALGVSRDSSTGFE